MARTGKAKRFRITSEELRSVTARLRVVGMHCASCAFNIEKQVKRLPGVRSVRVSFATGEAVVEFDPSRVRLSDVVRAVRELGYDVAREEVVLRVEGLSSHDDEVVAEEALARLPGVIEAFASRATGSVRVVFNPLMTSVEELREALEKAGFRVRGVASKLEAVREEARPPWRKALLCLGVAVAYILLLHARLWGLVPLSKQVVEYIGAVAAGFVLAYGGRGFFVSALRGLRNRVAGMDLLVSLGSGSAYVYSLAVALGLAPGMSFFEAAAAIVSVVLLGRCIELEARIRLGRATARLTRLEIPRARVVRDGRVVEVPVEELRVGDLIEVREGERVPADGIVVEGRAAIDESVFTGEPVPVPRGPGDRVLAGTVVVEGYVRARVTRVGRDTLLAQVARLVEYAQAAKPRVQRLADRAAGLLAWIAVTAAAITFSYWYFVAGRPLEEALMHAIAVLVVTCPCALGLAAPLAVAAGLWRGASQGIVVRNIDAVEKSRRLSLVAFDKTGTLTEGRPSVYAVKPVEGVSEEELLRLAAAAELRSRHPIAQAIVEEARRRGIEPPEPEEFESIPGQGIIARVEGRTVAIGNRSLMEAMEVDVSGLREVVERLEAEGCTVVYVAVDGRAWGVVALMDRPRRDAEETIRELKRMGLRLVMLTGDSWRTAKAVAARLGIDDVVAELKPEDKAEQIRRFQRSGHTVAMVGDGVNDAPSLAQADIGIAVPSGTDLAKQAGDVVLVAGGLYGVVRAVKLLRAIHRKVVENLAWAVVYNAILVPVAAGVLYPHVVLRPEMAAAAMVASSVSVTLNSLSLAAPILRRRQRRSR